MTHAEVVAALARVKCSLLGRPVEIVALPQTSASVECNSVTIELSVAGPERDTGDLVIIRRTLATHLGGLTEARLLDYAEYLAVDFAKHEIAETFFVDGVRPADPHVMASS